MPFLCPENAPQKCKWLQCVRLVINKRRSPTGDASAPHRRPSASRSGADQAHTLSLKNRPLNRLLLLSKITNARNSFARQKARRGAEPSPLNRSGSAAAFPAACAFFIYVCMIFVISIRFKPPLYSLSCLILLAFYSFTFKFRVTSVKNSAPHKSSFDLSLMKGSTSCFACS